MEDHSCSITRGYSPISRPDGLELRRARFAQFIGVEAHGNLLLGSAQLFVFFEQSPPVSHKQWFLDENSVAILEILRSKGAPSSNTRLGHREVFVAESLARGDLGDHNWRELVWIRVYLFNRDGFVVFRGWGVRDCGVFIDRFQRLERESSREGRAQAIGRGEESGTATG